MSCPQALAPQLSPLLAPAHEILELALPALGVCIGSGEGGAVDGAELVVSVVHFAESSQWAGEDDPVDFLVLELREGLVDDLVQFVLDLLAGGTVAGQLGVEGGVGVGRGEGVDDGGECQVVGWSGGQGLLPPVFILYSGDGFYFFLKPSTGPLHNYHNKAGHQHKAADNHPIIGHQRLTTSSLW